VIVVDNSGCDLAAAPDAYGRAVDVIQTTNGGFGAAANLGIGRARARGAERIVVLNDDVVVDPGWLEPLLAGFDSVDVGAVQPKLLLGAEQPSRINSVGVALDRHGAGVDVGWGQPDGPIWSSEVCIDIFTGGAVMFCDRFIDDMGGFDERYFLYYEDVDLALRGSQRGWSYRCAMASRVHHWAGSSTDRLGDSRRYLQERNRLWVAFRFATVPQLARALSLSIRRLRHPPRSVHRRALCAGLAGAPSALWRRWGRRR
jgi:GT2 family glycosyltransferase